MKNINKYSTSIDYQNAVLGNSERPSISYAEDINFIYFNEQYNNETDDKRFARVGDWVLAKADGSKLFVGNKVYQSKYINNSEWTAIAKVVLPYDAFGDKTVRCCSLVHMSCSNPETGSTTKSKIYWGDSSHEVANLESYSNRYQIVPGTTSVSMGTGVSYVATDSFKTTPSLDNRAFYNEVYTSAHKYSIPVYDGDKVWDFLKTIPNVWTNGRRNTDIIAAEITADISGSTIANNHDAGNYPAASCCLRFHTIGTSAGDWYLPSIYELLALYERNKVIKLSLASHYYWSSTQYSSTTAHVLGIYDGSLADGNKNANFYVLGFIAF